MLFCWPNYSLLGAFHAYVALDLNIWHACLLTQAEGSSFFELVETTMATGFQLSSEHHFELIGVQQRAARMIE